MYQKKRLSQIFLHDHNIILKMCRLAGNLSQSHVIEIGCGKGILSQALAERSKRLDIVEVDDTWLTLTQEKLKAFETVHFHHSSILEQAVWECFPQPFHIIANIPYHLTSDFLEQLIVNKNNCTKAIVMIQKEVAQKWVANVGKKYTWPKAYFASITLRPTYCLMSPKHVFTPNLK